MPKVSELIDQLYAMDHEAEVVIVDDNYNFFEIEDVVYEGDSVALFIGQPEQGGVEF